MPPRQHQGGRPVVPTPTSDLAWVVRAHQHAAGARHALPPTSPRRTSPAPRLTQGAGPDDKKSGPSTDREALGRSRGGLTTKIHPAADARARPISRVITPRQRHDAVVFEPVMVGIRIRIRRRGRGRPRTRPGRVLGDKAYSSRPIRADAGSGPPFPNGSTSRPTEPGEAARAGGYPSSTPRPAKAAMLPSAASTSSNSSARWPPATTNASTSSTVPSTSPRSESGSAIPPHDLPDMA
jgi:hypothetical protein